VILVGLERAVMKMFFTTLEVSIYLRKIFHLWWQSLRSIKLVERISLLLSSKEKYAWFAEISTAVFTCGCFSSK
jgi:hypothetical protein